MVDDVQLEMAVSSVIGVSCVGKSWPFSSLCLFCLAFLFPFLPFPFPWIV